MPSRLNSSLSDTKLTKYAKGQCPWASFDSLKQKVTTQSWYQTRHSTSRGSPVSARNLSRKHTYWKSFVEFKSNCSLTSFREILIEIKTRTPQCLVHWLQIVSSRIRTVYHVKTLSHQSDMQMPLAQTKNCCELHHNSMQGPCTSMLTDQGFLSKSTFINSRR